MNLMVGKDFSVQRALAIKEMIDEFNYNKIKKSCSTKGH